MDSRTHDDVVKEARRLLHAATQGRLNERAAAEQFEGGDREILEAFNGVLDAVAGPLDLAVTYAGRISKGDIPDKITDTYPGDFHTLMTNLNACIDSLGVVGEVNHVLRRIIVNDYTSQIQGSYQGIFAELATLSTDAPRRVKNAIRILGDVAAGDYRRNLEDMRKVGRRSENDQLIPSLIKVMSTIDKLVADAATLLEAAMKGELSTRADASQHQGEYRKVIQGVNDILDAVIAPMQEAGVVLQKVAGGDLTARVEGNYHGDHARIKNDINTMTEALSTSMAQIEEHAQGLASSSEELSAVATQMSSNAEETASQSGVVSAASEQVSKNIQTVATATEEMSASIKEIAKNAAESARVAATAVQAAETTNATVTRLGDSSREIGQVVKVITSVAQQTNLLALNATIEAARAGEAGKGFAVVAHEVKELAKETAKATGDISGKIEAIQINTKQAVEAIAQIGAIIHQINDISGTIASAVEEQTATTNEIARNVSEAAKGSSQIAENITSVARAAKSTTEGAANSQTAAQDLARMASELDQLVRQFDFDNVGGGATSTPNRLAPQPALVGQGVNRARTQPGLTARLH
jgi:methyl-accepting chemotaxis protein